MITRNSRKKNTIKKRTHNSKKKIQTQVEIIQTQDERLESLREVTGRTFDAILNAGTEAMEL